MKILEWTKVRRCDEKEYLTYTHKACSRCEAVKAVTQFYRKKTKTARGWAWDSICIECRRAQCVEYGHRSRDMRNKRLQKWRRQNPAAAKAADRRKRLKRDYGITPIHVEEMRRRQDGACAICSHKTSRLFVDHCHATGKVRALLCQTCNTFLGWYERKAETILRFQRYIDGHQ